jgi:hypothetical protein
MLENIGLPPFLDGGLRIAPYFGHTMSGKAKPSQGRGILLAMQVEHELRRGEDTFFAAALQRILIGKKRIQFRLRTFWRKVNAL